jgi:peptide chain release factor subunit 1
MELVESQQLLEWLANNYKSFGATLEIITDKSQEGSQFVRGFGGIGGMWNLEKNFSHFFFHFISYIFRYFTKGILRYKVDFQSMAAEEEPLDDVDLDDY